MAAGKTLSRQKMQSLMDRVAELVECGKRDKAIDAMRPLLQSCPDDVSVQSRAAELFRDAGRIHEAVDAMMSLVQIYAEDGLLLKAIAACRQIVAVDPSHNRAQRLLADLYARRRGKPKASDTGTAEAATVVAPKPATAITKNGACPPPRPSIPPPPPSPKSSELSPAAVDVDTVGQQSAGPMSRRSAEATQGGRPDGTPVSRGQRAAALPVIPLFSDLPKNAFIELLGKLESRSFATGETIVREGENADEMFVIVDGEVEIHRLATKRAITNESTRATTTLGEGAFFGEMALLSQSRRSASAMAASPVQLLVISRAVVDDVVVDYPSVRHTMMRFYKDRLVHNLLDSSEMFAPLGEQHKRALVHRFKLRRLPENMVILERGQVGDGLYLVLQGNVQVVVPDDDAPSHQREVARLTEGEVFGEMSLAGRVPVSATVRTLGKAVVVRLPRRTFVDVVAEYPEILDEVRKLVRRRRGPANHERTGRPVDVTLV